MNEIRVAFSREADNQSYVLSRWQTTRRKTTKDNVWQWFEAHCEVFLFRSLYLGDRNMSERNIFVTLFCSVLAFACPAIGWLFSCCSYFSPVLKFMKFKFVRKWNQFYSRRSSGIRLIDKTHKIVKNAAVNFYCLFSVDYEFARFCPASPEYWVNNSNNRACV